MKIRSGFVSNSSSSSYIVEIQGITMQKFLQDLAEKHLGYGCFDVKAIKAELNKDNKYAVTSVPHSTVDAQRLLDYKDRTERKLKRLAEADTDEAIMAFIIEHTGNKLYEKSGSVFLESWTSMHNDFSDMPKVLKEITLYFLFDTSHTIICRRIDES